MGVKRKLDLEWFSRDANVVAKNLLGKVLEHKGVSGMIVETESYKTDEASHAFHLTPRSKIMHETYGHFYVYFTYGMHYCLNVTTNKKGVGAVLIRALEPLSGIEKMMKRRHTKERRNLTSGPGKLTESLGIDKKLNGTRVGDQAFIYDYQKILPKDIGVSGRVGIKLAQDLPWRFFIKGNDYVSRK